MCNLKKIINDWFLEEFIETNEIELQEEIIKLDRQGEDKFNDALFKVVD